MTRRPLAILRPEPGWSATRAAAQALGLETCGQPLFAVEPVAWRVPRYAFDALLVGSANVFRHGGSGLAALTGLPVHCVGATTAAAARRAGFAVAVVGEGGLQSVLDRLAGPQRLLRLGGEERVALDPPEGIAIEELALYRTRALPLDPAMLPQGAVIALHSAAAARHLVAELARIGRSRADHAVCAIGSRVAEAAGDGWRALESAESPQDAGLLALAQRLCQ